ncbi:murein transglycosylase A [Candidatus Profftia sp. (ex Adelges kitamiensis)]|uniref:murein transglycosylase A n=1 Tax=Candidatus Profftia sp. (ex Adelges kitamiensis) TaxID=2864218 RepID=UPI001CE25331|nr:murein transglycosylase A [Candidatus Profftia sp. (ex Adelges kitamiensis)]
MNNFYKNYIIYVLLLLLLTGCVSHPISKGQQYKDGKINKPLILVDTPNIKGKPINIKDFYNQIDKIKHTSPFLYKKYHDTFKIVIKWLQAGGDINVISKFNLIIYQMAGIDHFGNVQLTGYYTPVIQARYTRQGNFQYPLYRMPIKEKNQLLPNRTSIYNGILDNRNLVLGYSNSLIDNFMMEVQGSGYVDYGDGLPFTFFGYCGNNGYSYYSIGKILIKRGDIINEEMSMHAIRQWAYKHSIHEVRALLEQNPSFVFFKPEKNSLVKGASGVPLLPKVSVACDSRLIPAGSTLLVEVPLLDCYGKFTGKYEIRLMLALDVGGVIKGQHCDIYQGIGQDAGEKAGFYNHYGRIWILESPIIQDYYSPRF